MEIEIPRDWCLAMAQQEDEDNVESIGAGLLSVDPQYENKMKRSKPLWPRY